MNFLLYLPWLAMAGHGFVYEDRLAPGGERAFRVTAPAHFQLVLEQGDTDYLLALEDASGRTVRTVDAFEFGTETATFTGPSPARWRVVVRRPGGTGLPASFRLKLIELREADAPRMRAEDLCTEAHRLRLRGDAASISRALTLAAEAAGLWRRIEKASAFCRAALMHAEILFALGRYADSRAVFQEALATGRTCGEKVAMAVSFNGLGIGFWQQNEFDQAVENLRQAVLLFDELGNSGGRAAALNNIGLVHMQTGEYAAAARDFHEALPVFQAIGNRRGALLVQNNLAVIYYLLGNVRLSVRTFDAVAGGLEQLPDYTAAGRTLATSTHAYLRLNDVRTAESHARHGLELARRSGDRRAVGEARNLLAEVLIRTGRADEAIALETGAIDLLAQAGDRRTQGYALTNLGIALRAKGDTVAALERFREARDLLHAIGTPASEASVLYQIATTARDRGELEAARQAIESAVSLAELVRGNIAGEDLRVSYLASQHEYVEAAIDILMRLAEETRDPAWIRAAWQMAERGRSRALFEAVRDRPPEGGDESARADWERLRKVQWLVSAETLQLGRGGGGQEGRRTRLSELFAERERLERRLCALDPERVRLADAPVPSLEEVQKFLGPGTALLEYAVGEERSYLWVLTAREMTVRRLPGRRVMTARIQRWLAALGNRPASAAASAALLGGAPLDAGLRRLIVVPDGPLHAVPFAALPAGRGTLLDRYEISAAPSAATLLALAARRRTRRPGRLVAILADPVFDARDARVHTASAPTRGSGFARLPFSYREAETVAALFPGRQTKLFTGFQASADVLTSSRWRHARILHLSTHASARGTQPELVLAQVHPDGRRRPGRLTAREIAALNLNIDLVVLNGCQTAAGRVVAGEGAMSLARAFLAAGAGRVVANLWSVDDEATAALLTHFYRALLSVPGRRPATALRQAQQALRRDPRWHSPSYWASLMLAGES